MSINGSIFLHELQAMKIRDKCGIKNGALFLFCIQVKSILWQVGLHGNEEQSILFTAFRSKYQSPTDSAIVCSRGQQQWRVVAKGIVWQKLVQCKVNHTRIVCWSFFNVQKGDFRGKGEERTHLSILDKITI